MPGLRDRGHATNALRVGTGGNVEFTTVQSAIDAAVAAGASATNPYAIRVAPDVELTYTRLEPDSGVTIIAEGVGRTVGDTFLEPLEGARQGTPVTVPYPSVCAIRLDDGLSATTGLKWFTNDAAWAAGDEGASSPFDYLAYYGIPCTLGIISDQVDDGGDALTADNLRDLFLFGGHEMASHCFGSGQPSTHALVKQHIMQSRLDLEALVDSNADKIGFPIRGFITPGAWAGAARIDTLAKTETNLGRYMRLNYEWSQAYLARTATGALSRSGSVHAIKHFANTCLTNIDTATADTIDDFLDSLTAPGARAVITGHPHRWTAGDLGTDKITRFKELIDGLVTLRTNGDCLPVTLSTLYNAILTPRQSTGGSRCEIEWGVRSGTFELSDLDLENWRYGMFIQASGTTVASLVASVGNTLHAWPQGNCLQLDRNGQTDALNFRLYPCLPAGNYLMRFDVRCIQADAGVNDACIVDVWSTGYVEGESPVQNWGYPKTTLVDDTWQMMYVPFSIGTQELYYQIQVNVKNAAGSVNATMQVDNIGIIQI